MTQTAYLFDPATRRYTRPVQCQTCPKAGTLLRPANSLLVPPPPAFELAVIVAVGNDWTVDMDASRAAAMEAVDQFHADAVQSLVGSPTQVEKDTWALKVRVAGQIIDGLPLDADGANFLNAVGYSGDEARLMWAQSVKAAAAQYAVVVGVAERIRGDARKAISAAEDAQQLAQAIQEFKAAAAQAKAQMEAARHG